MKPLSKVFIIRICLVLFALLHLFRFDLSLHSKQVV